MEILLAERTVHLKFTVFSFFAVLHKPYRLLKSLPLLRLTFTSQWLALLGRWVSLSPVEILCRSSPSFTMASMVVAPSLSVASFMNDFESTIRLALRAIGADLNRRNCSINHIFKFIKVCKKATNDSHLNPSKACVCFSSDILIRSGGREITSGHTFSKPSKLFFENILLLFKNHESKTHFWFIHSRLLPSDISCETHLNILIWS